MLVKFLQNLGTDDARYCKAKFGEVVPSKECVIGAVVDVPEKSAEYLAAKYPAMFEPANRVKGQAKQAEVIAPAK